MYPDFLNDIDIWSPEILALLIGSGFLIGVINTLAGSGTAIGYAVFMALGLPPSWANGTVRIGVIPQTFAAAFNFYKHKLLNIKSALYIAVPITIGSVAGAQIAVSIDQEVFKKVIGVAMLILLFFIFFKPENLIKSKSKETKVKHKLWHTVLYFAIGAYGGFIHVGVGIFLLIALVAVSGYDLVKANSLKVFVVFIYTPFALAVFMIHGEVYYAIGLISAVGNTLGGIIASNFAIKHGTEPLRWFLIIVIVVFSGYLFGFLKL
ncbi:MAG: sulfite exporter TauE/SafE family protein [Bacteroidales bacterium]|nr:sulfite exporter TauE/SafE family protein [Bacteroidales bacterium]